MNPEFSNNPFAPAKMLGNHLRIALDGPAGSGKTFTALIQACLVLGGTATEFGAMLSRRENGMARIAVIDTERGSASKYAKYFEQDGGDGSAFDTLNLARQSSGAVEPKDFINAIDAANKYGYEAIIVDSLSHAWEGILDQKDKVDEREKAKSKGNYTNTFANWREITPLHNRLIDTILNFPGHVFVTMRTKVEYVQEKDEKGYTKIRKLGLKPVQRDGVDYEFDIVLDMMENTAYVGKSRCKELTEQAHIERPGTNMAQILREWLDLSEPVMSREHFMANMAMLGYESIDSIQDWIKLNKLAHIGGADKYNRLWEIANNQQADVDMAKAAGE